MNAQEIGILLCKEAGLNPNDVESLIIKVNHRKGLRGKAVCYLRNQTGHAFLRDGEIAKELKTISIPWEKS